MRFQCYEAIGVAIGEAGNVTRRRPPHRGHPLLALPVPGHPGRHRRVGDGGQPVPPAQDPLLDAHHRVQPRALRAPRGGAQRAAPAGRRVHRRHRPLPARRHPLPERRHPAHLLRRQAAAAHAACVLQRGRAPRASCAPCPPQIDEICGRRDTLMHFLRKQAARGVVQPAGRLQPRRAASTGSTLDPSGLEPYISANTLERGARRGGSGRAARTSAARGAAGVAASPTAEAAPARSRAAAGEAAPAPERLGDAASTRLRPWRRTPLEARARAPGTARDGDGAGGARREPEQTDRRRVALHGAHPPAAGSQVLAVGRRRRRGGRPAPAARRPRRAQPLRARRSTAWQRGPRRRTPRPPARRRARPCSRSSRRSSSARPRRWPTENIYQKRHIAAGIPSIYGNYSEPKFDALGLSFRVENLVGRLLDDLVAEGIEPYVTRASLRRMVDGHRGASSARSPSTASTRAPSSANLEHARGELRQPQLHVPPVPERLPVPRQQRHRALDERHPQPRPGAAHRAHQRPAAVRGALHVGRRRRRDGPARGAGLGPGHAGPRPLRGGRAAPISHAQRPARAARPSRA